MTCYKQVSLNDEIQTWHNKVTTAYFKIRTLINDEREKRDGFNAKMETTCIGELENLSVSKSSGWYEKLTLYAIELPTMDRGLLYTFDSRDDIWSKQLVQYAREVAVSEIREKFLLDELRSLNSLSSVMLKHLRVFQLEMKDKPEIDTGDILDDIFNDLTNALSRADFSKSFLVSILNDISNMKGMETISVLYKTDTEGERNWLKSSSAFTINPALVMGKVKTVISKFIE